MSILRSGYGTTEDTEESENQGLQERREPRIDTRKVFA